MAGAAAGDEADLARGGLGASDEAVLGVEGEASRMAEDEALQRLGDELVGVVDDAASHEGPSRGRMLRPDSSRRRPAPHRARYARSE